jgi:hypothetical protein
MVMVIAIYLWQVSQWKSSLIKPREELEPKDIPSQQLNERPSINLINSKLQIIAG